MLIHNQPGSFISLKKINDFWLVDASHLTKAMMRDSEITKRVLGNAIDSVF